MKRKRASSAGVLEDTVGFYRYLAARSARNPLYLARTLSHRRRSDPLGARPGAAATKAIRRELTLKLYGVAECADDAPCTNTQRLPLRIVVLEEHAPTGSITGEALYRIADAVELEVPLLTKIACASAVGRTVRVPINFDPIIDERRRYIVVALAWACDAEIYRSDAGAAPARDFRGHHGERLGELLHAARVPRALAPMLELLTLPPAMCGTSTRVPPCYFAHFALAGARCGRLFANGEYSYLLKCASRGTSGAVPVSGGASSTARARLVELQEPLLNFAIEWVSGAAEAPSVAAAAAATAAAAPGPSARCSDLPVNYCFWVDRDSAPGRESGSSELQLTTKRDTFHCPLCGELTGDLSGLLCHLRASHSRCNTTPTVSRCCAVFYTIPPLDLSLSPSLSARSSRSHPPPPTLRFQRLTRRPRPPPRSRATTYAGHGGWTAGGPSLRLRHAEDNAAAAASERTRGGGRRIAALPALSARRRATRTRRRLLLHRAPLSGLAPSAERRERDGYDALPPDALPHRRGSVSSFLLFVRLISFCLLIYSLFTHQVANCGRRSTCTTRGAR